MSGNAEPRAEGLWRAAAGWSMLCDTWGGRRQEAVMGMERHEVPTVFVRGVAAPSDVGYADQRLQAVLLECPCAVRYAVLWIATDGVDGIEVEIEIGSADAPISARAVGTKLCDTADACLELLVDQLTATLV